jgi:hypothetical protein
VSEVEASGEDRAGRILMAELNAAEARMHEEDRAASRHGLFALLGASPATLLPLFGIGLDLGPSVLLVASVGVALVEGWRSIRARGRAASEREHWESLQRQLASGTTEE